MERKSKQVRTFSKTHCLEVQICVSEGDVGSSERVRKGEIAVGPALLYFVAAYVLVTVLAAGLTITYGAIHHSPDPGELGVGMLQAPAFVATVPYHVLIMLLIWPMFAWLYFRKQRSGGAEQESKATMRLAFLWLISAMAVDYVGFVLIKNPWSMTTHELYVEYQPWISLIYLSIFLSPWIRLGISRWIKEKNEESLFWK